MTRADPDEIAEIARLIRLDTGAPCYTQAAVLHALAAKLGDADTTPMPNLAELARGLGMTRQVVSTAFAALVRKGLVRVAARQVDQVVSKPVVLREISVSLPAAEQLALPMRAAAS